MKRLYTALFIFGFALGASAQGLLPELGEQRAGIASATFLKIGVGARAAAMGGAYTAMANDASALYWNPAGLAQIGQNELVVSHLDWLVDIDLEYLGYTHQINENIAVGAFINFLHLADMPVTDEYHPYGNGHYFSYSDMATGLSASIKMTDRFSFGITGKYVREDIDNLHMDAVLVDFGTFYWTGFRTLRIAASVRNFGGDFQPGGAYLRRETGSVTEAEYQSFSAPAIFSIGAAMDVYSENEHVVTMAAEMNHPMDNKERFIVGGEYRFKNTLAVRTGYSGGNDENRWTFGAGLLLHLFGKQFKFDYAYADYENITMTQQLTFGFEF